MDHLLPSEEYPHAPSADELAQRERERELYIGLPGSLSGFNGTPGARIFEEVLQREGIAPSAYNPKEHGHYDYCGYLATEGDNLGYHGTEPSPVLVEIFNKIAREELIGTDVDYNAYTLNPESPNYTMLTRTGLVQAIVTTKEHDDIVGYFVALGNDGGRAGSAFVAPSDIIAVNEQK